MHQAILVAKLITLIMLIPVGVMFVARGDMALGAMHFAVLPWVAWTTWQRLYTRPRPVRENGEGR